jgi:hypothetical protein
VRTLRFALLACAAGITALAASNTPTFTKDVLPVFQKNCQGCHRPGEVAPMSLLTYQDARPWAKAIKQAVVTRKMPPWFADPVSVHFSNDRTLSPQDINTIVSWVDGGAPEGDPKDAPAPVTFQNGWNIKPDMIVEMPNEFHLPATGTINYQYIRVKGNFPEDVWVEAAEMRPSNSAVLHHGKVWVIPPGSKWMANAQYGVPYEGKEAGGNEPGDGNDILGKFNPGLGPQRFDVVDGAAKLIPKGSDLVFELHYTAVGKPATDKSKLGIVFAKNKPKVRYVLSHGTPAALNMSIAPGDPNAEVVSEVTFDTEAKLVYVQPHMHLRGKDYELRLIYPTGETQTVFRGKFDFEWQLGYDLAQPLTLPKGTRMVGIAHYDNSPNNKFNPDPSKEVHWGLQNWEEMQSVFVGMLVDMKTDPDRIFHASGPSLLPRPKAGPTLEALNSK